MYFLRQIFIDAIGSGCAPKWASKRGTNFLSERPIKPRDGIMAVPRKHTQDFHMLFWRYEKEIEPEILDLRRGEAFVDAGANVGYYTLKAASILLDNKNPDNYAQRIISIEPHPGNYEALCRNIACNGFTSVIPINKAVWESRSSLEMHIREFGKRLSTDDPSLSFDHDETSSIKSQKKIVVQTDTLDNILQENNIRNIGVLKLDVEGAEVHALKGAKNTMQEARKIVVEVHGTGSNSGNGSSNGNNNNNNNNMEQVKSILINNGLVFATL